MKNFFVASWLFLSLFFSTVQAQDASSHLKTFGDFLVQKQREVMTPSVQFCRSSLPALATRLDAAHARFSRVTDEAMAPMLVTLRDVLSKPMLDQSPQIPDAGQQLLASGKREGSQAFCPHLLQIMEHTNSEDLRPIIEQQYASLLEKARSRTSLTNK